MLTPSPDPGLSEGYSPAAPPRRPPSPRPRTNAAPEPAYQPAPRADDPEAASYDPEPSFRLPGTWRRGVRQAFGGHRAWAAGEMRHAPLEVRVNVVVRTALLVGALLAGALVLWSGNAPDEGGPTAAARFAVIALLALALGLVVLVGVAVMRPPPRVRTGFLRVGRPER